MVLTSKNLQEHVFVMNTAQKCSVRVMFGQTWSAKIDCLEIALGHTNDLAGFKYLIQSSLTALTVGDILYHGEI